MTTERHWFPLAGMHFYAFPHGERPTEGYANPCLYRCEHVADFVVVSRAIRGDTREPSDYVTMFPIGHFHFHPADNLVEFLQSRGEKT